MAKISLIPVIFLLVLLIIWEACSQISPELHFVLPPPSEVIKLVWQRADRFWFHTAITFKEMAGAFLLTLAISFPLAWLMSEIPAVRLMMQPFFVIIQCVPMFALAPIMVIWFGWSYLAIVIPAALFIFFPLTMNLYKGFQATPQAYVDFFRLHQATKWQLFFKLQLPWSLPHLFAGFRIAAAVSGVGAVVGEWAGAQEGLGTLMIESRRGADLETMFGALLCLTLMTVGIYATIILLEKIISKKMVLHALLLSVLLSSCQQSSDQKEVRLMLDWQPNPNHVPLYVGIEKKFFEEKGIALKILKLHDPSDSTPYLTSKQADLALNYMPHIIRAIELGAQIEPIAILINEPLNALIYRKDLGVKNKQDLDGKILGYCMDGVNLSFLDRLLKKNGIVPKQKLNVSFDAVSMMMTKRVDMVYGAYWNIEPECWRQLGLETDHISLPDLGFPSYYELMVVAQKDSVQTSKDFVDSFREALQRSIDFSIENPEESFEIYLKHNPDKSQKTQKWEWEAWKKTLPVYPSIQKINQQIWDEFQGWFSQQKVCS